LFVVVGWNIVLNFHEFLYLFALLFRFQAQGCLHSKVGCWPQVLLDCNLWTAFGCRMSDEKFFYFAFR